MCFLFSDHYRKFDLARLVWQEREGVEWGDGDEEKKHEDALRKGRETTYRPPEPTPEVVQEGGHKPIDPGKVVLDRRTRLPKENLKERFPKLKPIIEKMDEIGQREFWNRNPEALSGDNLSDYLQVAEKMQEAILYRALVENWSEETLYDVYGQVMGDLYTKCAGRPLMYEVWGQMKRGWHWLLQSENLGVSKPNEYLERTRKIKSAEKPKLIADLIKLETQLFNGDDVCLEFSGGECDDWEDRDDLDEDRLEFIQDDLIAFYRNWIINKGIVENRTKDEVKDAYAKLLAKLAKSCETD